MSIRHNSGEVGKGVGFYVAVVLLLLIVIATVVFIFGGFSRLTADFRGGTEVREKTVANGDYRIASYDKFYDDCAAVQGVEDQINNVKATKGGNQQRDLLALRNQRIILIRSYNADARKAGTRGQFRASDLPFQIDPSQGTTTC